MRCTGFVAALIVLTMAAGAPARAANVCQANTLSCATTMPIGGYCECTSRGTTQDGTVVAKAPAGHRTNSNAAGCGARPDAPGCR
jgi:hypothetical protein